MRHAAKPKTGSFRVLVADDHLLIRQIIGAMLKRDPNLSIVGEAAHGSEAISMATARLHPTTLSWTSICQKSTGSKRQNKLKPHNP